MPYVPLGIPGLNVSECYMVLTTHFSCWKQLVIPSGKDGTILPARVDIYNTVFGSSCPLLELPMH